MSTLTQDHAAATRWGAAFIHGAFRGGWSWQLVERRLRERGWDTVAPTLTGCEPATARMGSIVELDEWIADTVSAVESLRERVDRVILVSHSQGGLVSAAAQPQLGPRVDGVLYIDAPVPLDGQRGIDLNPPGSPPPPEGIDPATWVPARPVGPDDGFVDVELAAFVNSRLTPTPVGPSLTPVSLRRDERRTITRHVFCTDTPATYPCWSTRARLDAQGVPYVLIESAHDAPLLASEAVVAQIVGLAGEVGH